MTNAEAVNWLINITADIGKIEHQELWHYEQALSEIREMLENMPTVEPQRIRGRWKTFGWNGVYCECSECGHTYSRQFYFCPNCGAEMGGQDEVN